MHSTIAGASAGSHERSVTIPSLSTFNTIGRGAVFGGVPFGRNEKPVTTVDMRAGGDLSVHGFDPTGHVIWSPTTSVLYEHAVVRGDARIAEGGPLVVDTGMHTGRSPRTSSSCASPAPRTASGGAATASSTRRASRACATRSSRTWTAQPTLYVVDAFAGADPGTASRVRVVTTQPYHALFAKTMFIEPTRGRARRLRAAGARAPRARGRGRSRGRRHAHRHVRRPAPDAHGAARSAARSTPARSRSRSSR